MRVFWLVMVVGAGCASLEQDTYRQRAESALKAGFAGGDPKILARVERQDAAQRLCSEHRDAPPAAIAASIRSEQRAALRYPASGRLMGDWREGKAIAEDTGGLRYGDPAGKPAGGNCYACHRLEARELAYGTLGPSLLGYGKKRSASKGGADAAAQRETYERLYNAQAFTACSAMPRFGHNGVLTPEQIAHLVALLLDPASPVNR